MLDLRPADGFTDYFVIMTGHNVRQLQAISDAIQDALNAKGVKPAHIEGGDRAGWILLDYFDHRPHLQPKRRLVCAGKTWDPPTDRVADPPAQGLG